MIIDGVNVTADEKIFSKTELKNYVEYTANELGGKKFSELEVTMADDGKVDLNYTLEKVPFERIRRITGPCEG